MWNDADLRYKSEHWFIPIHGMETSEGWVFFFQNGTGLRKTVVRKFGPRPISSEELRMFFFKIFEDFPVQFHSGFPKIARGVIRKLQNQIFYRGKI